MKCNFCDKPAKVFLTQLTDGTMKKLCLCDSCAKEYGIMDPSGYSLGSQLMENMVQSIIASHLVNDLNIKEQRICPNCLFTQEDFNRVRRFGCSECYQTFHEGVEAVLKNYHRSTKHVGRVPVAVKAKMEVHQRLEQLKQRLEKAVAKESYEEAAGIRDEINTIPNI